METTFMDEVDELVQQGYTMGDVLAHYGVKGMRWGQKSAGKRASAHQPGDSEDHTRARTLHTVAKKQGTRKLTNKDLEDLNKRLNLEQNYSNLTSKTKQKNAIAKGASAVGKRLGSIAGQMGDEVVKAHIKVALLEKGVIPTGAAKK